MVDILYFLGQLNLVGYHSSVILEKTPTYKIQNAENSVAKVLDHGTIRVLRNYFPKKKKKIIVII
jgi:aromatic ring-opening dioxygenase catalytic subunit (LigB family)